MDSTAESRFYRQLFLRRYALLLEKAEHAFRIPPETMEYLRSRILALAWVDSGVEKLEMRLHPALHPGLLQAS